MLSSGQAGQLPACHIEKFRTKPGKIFNAYRIHISGDEEVRFDVVRNGAAREVAFQRGVRALDSGACPATGDFFCTRSMQIRGEALIHLSGSYENLQDRHTMFFLKKIALICSHNRSIIFQLNVIYIRIFYIQIIKDGRQKRRRTVYDRSPNPKGF